LHIANSISKMVLVVVALDRWRAALAPRVWFLPRVGISQHTVLPKGSSLGPNGREQARSEFADSRGRWGLLGLQLAERSRIISRKGHLEQRLLHIRDQPSLILLAL
jgi:hypothetical protein